MLKESENLGPADLVSDTLEKMGKIEVINDIDAGKVKKLYEIRIEMPFHILQ